MWRQLWLGSYKSAWLMCAKLRCIMVAPGRSPLSDLSEVDGDSLPHQGRSVGRRQRRSAMARCPFASAVEVHTDPGRVRLARSPNFSADSLCHKVCLLFAKESP